MSCCIITATVTQDRERLWSQEQRGDILKDFAQIWLLIELWWTPTTEIFKWWSSHWHEQRWFLEGFCSESVWWLKSLAGLSQRPSWINFLRGSSTDCSKLLVGIYTIWKILGDATKIILSLGFCYCYPCYCLIQEGKIGGSGGGWGGGGSTKMICSLSFDPNQKLFAA